MSAEIPPLTPAQALETQQPQLIALCTVMLVLSMSALGLRLWSNHIAANHRWGWDDFFATITLPSIIAEMGLIYWWIDLGLGKHAATVPPEDLAQAPKIIFVAAFLYDCNISLPKFAALFFYRRIFGYVSRWLSIALWVVGAMNAGWLLSALLSTIFQCRPVNAAWRAVEGAECISQWGWFLGTAIPSMIIDFFILVLPLPLLWGLRAPASRRLMVVLVFLCGYCVIVVSIGRLVTLAQAGAHLLTDITWTTITYVEWVQCEGPISLISVCLPNIFRFVQVVRQRGDKGTLPDSRACTKMASAANGQDKRQFIRMEDYPSQIYSETGTGSEAPISIPLEEDPPKPVFEV